MELIPLGMIDDNPFQTRTEYDEASIEELALDIRAHGLLQTPVGRVVGRAGKRLPTYTQELWALGKELDGDVGRVQLAFGHRRLRAHRWLAAQPDAPLGEAEMAVELRDLSDEEMATFAWSENAKRRDLSAVEAARSIERMVKEFGWTQEEVAARLGISRPTVSNRLRLLKLPEEVQARVRAGEVSERQAMALLPLTEAPKHLLTKMEKEAWEGDKPSAIMAQAGEKASDEIRERIAHGVRRVTFVVNGDGWCAAVLEGEGIRHAACEGCPERVRLGDELRCGWDACRKARLAVWQAQELAAAAKASGLALLSEEEQTGRAWATLEYAPEPEKIIGRGCSNLRLRWNEWGGQRVSVAGHPQVEIVCCNGGGGKCKCATAAKAAVTRQAHATAGDEEKEERELAQRVQREVLEPATEAVLEALLAGELGVWRKLAQKADYQANTRDDWPLSRLQKVVARGLVKNGIYLSPGQSFDQQRNTVEGVLSNMDVRAPWKLAPAAVIERKLGRMAEWIKASTRGAAWEIRESMSSEAIAGNVANLDHLEADLASVADIGDDARRALEGRIAGLRETLGRLKEIIPELTQYPLGWENKRVRLFHLVDVAPKSMVFDEALAGADAFLVRYALALCAPDDAVREGELRRRLGELEDK